MPVFALDCPLGALPGSCSATGAAPRNSHGPSARPCGFASRYLLTCAALSTTLETFAFTVFERAFKEFGLPHAFRTDNGVPFASAHALYGLSKLAVGGRGSASRSSASSRALRNKTAGTECGRIRPCT